MKYPGKRLSTSVESAVHILSVSTAAPDSRFSQRELLDLLAIKDARITSIFLNGGIERRSISVPRVLGTGEPLTESQGELLQRHRTCGVEIATRAIHQSLRKIDARISDINYLCCVTSTGFLTPGLSALLSHHLGIKQDCTRLDIVGMGCNAGLNGMNAAASWAQTNPGNLALMVCVEVCSAAYVVDTSMQTAVVNSLFGDGAAAVTLSTEKQSRHPSAHPAATILKFNSCLIPNSLNAMGFNWDTKHGKFSFFLDREVPYVIGAHMPQVVDGLLSGARLRQSDVTHWIIHSGGKRVVDSVRANLHLTKDDVRHTLSTLRDYGNVSSGAFLFSLERLSEEGRAREGDYGVMITMGPGATIETALIRW